MESSKAPLFSAIASVVKEAVEKAKTNAQSLADMYVQVKYDDQTFSVFDDAGNLLAQVVLDDWGTWYEENGGESSTDALITLLRGVLEDESVNQALRSLEPILPFSVVLVDASMDVITELITFDDENIYLHDEFWAKMDKELDDFFEQLMNDTK